jgi:hypothetical protein
LAQKPGVREQAGVVRIADEGALNEKVLKRGRLTRDFVGFRPHPKLKVL